MAVGCALGLTSCFLSSLTTNFWLFFILYGCGFGICNGIAYIVPIYNGWHYYPHNKGLVSGIILAGFGFGAFTFNYVSSALVNPDGIEGDHGHYPKEVADRVPFMIKILSLCWLGLSIIGILMIFPFKAETKLEKEEAVKVEEEEIGGSFAYEPVAGEKQDDITEEEFDNQAKKKLITNESVGSPKQLINRTIPRMLITSNLLSYLFRKLISDCNFSGKGSTKRERGHFQVVFVHSSIWSSLCNDLPLYLHGSLYDKHFQNVRVAINSRQRLLNNSGSDFFSFWRYSFRLVISC